jgi:hypothetical protein
MQWNAVSTSLPSNNVPVHQLEPLGETTPIVSRGQSALELNQRSLASALLDHPLSPRGALESKLLPLRPR